MDPPPAVAAAGSSCGEEMAERSETVGDGGIWGDRRGLGLELCGADGEAPSWSGCGEAMADMDDGSAIAAGVSGFRSGGRTRRRTAGWTVASQGGGR